MYIYCLFYFLKFYFDTDPWWWSHEASKHVGFINKILSYRISVNNIVHFVGQNILWFHIGTYYIKLPDVLDTVYSPSLLKHDTLKTALALFRFGRPEVPSLQASLPSVKKARSSLRIIVFLRNIWFRECQRCYKYIIYPTIVRNLSAMRAACSFYFTCIYSINLIALHVPNYVC